MTIKTVRSTAVVLALVLGMPSAFGQLVPDATNYRRWIEFITPSEEERSFERIGWRHQFWPAVEEARRLGRPILLWTMNGHPLGCT